jgi:CheY-like chemotaxis protein
MHGHALSLRSEGAVIALNLLIADDSADDARLVAHAMKRAGYAVQWQRVDDEADFARALPGVDLVICDYAMPRFSPVRALELIREAGHRTPLLLISGTVSEESASRIMGLGAVGYLLKDRLDQLGEAVCSALGRGAAKPEA